MELFEGRVIAGKFRLEQRIGLGSMGEVWSARHLALGAPVAVKFMSEALMKFPLAWVRFEREARAAAQIRSPHIVQVLDHGVDEGAPFMVMELLEGEDLATRLRRVRRMSLPEAAVIATQVGKGLRAAHDTGIIHRDLKPSNVFLARVHGEEVVKLLDFGVAKLTLADEVAGADATATGSLIGTPNYMSPEQARGAKALDHRTDLWSFGVILYYAVTGTIPFAGDAIGDTLVKICTYPLPPPTTIVFELPPAVDWFFQRACARDPKSRFETATDLAAAFAAVAQGRALPAGAIREGMSPPSAGAAGAAAYSGPVAMPVAMKEPPRGPRVVLILLGLFAVLLLALIGSRYLEQAARGVLKGF